MSNVAYVVPNKKFPAIPVITEYLQDIVAKKFPNFKVHTISGGWLIAHKTNEDIAFRCWITKYTGTKKAIQIPHRHRYDFMWWVEYEIREALAIVLKARQIDDGVGDVENHEESYATYSDYLRAIYPVDWLQPQVELTKLRLLDVPKYMLDMLGDLF